MMKLMLIVLAVFLGSFCYAGNKAEHEAWEKKALEKELRRAKEAQKHMGDTERFEKKYGWAGEKLSAKYQTLINAAKQSSQAWKAVEQKAAAAKSPKELLDVKEAAYNADEATYFAELTLKIAGGALGREHMIEKSGNSKEVAAAAAELDQTEQKLLDAHRAKMEAAKALRKAERENRAIHEKLKEAYEKARAAKHSIDKGKKK